MPPSAPGRGFLKPLIMEDASVYFFIITSIAAAAVAIVGGLELLFVLFFSKDEDESPKE
jgi:hypothetical protein